jgi:hypothetical protein
MGASLLMNCALNGQITRHAKLARDRAKADAEGASAHDARRVLRVEVLKNSRAAAHASNGLRRE